MKVPAGNVEYTLGHPPITGFGVSWSREELDAALAEDAFVPYITPGGKAANIADHLARWKIPFRVP